MESQAPGDDWFDDDFNVDDMLKAEDDQPADFAPVDVAEGEYDEEEEYEEEEDDFLLKLDDDLYASEEQLVGDDSMDFTDATPSIGTIAANQASSS